MKTLPLKNSQPHPYTQKFVLEARDRETGELLFGSRPSHKPKLPRGDPQFRDSWSPEEIANLYYKMNPQDDGPAAGWETICQFFDSINWFWRPKTW